MNNSNLTEFKNDFNNLLRCEDIMDKYNISKTTYHTIVRKLGLKRPKTSKLLRMFNTNFTDNNKPIEQQNSNIQIVDETEDKLLYSKQYVPKGTKLDIEKTKPKPTEKTEIEEPKQDDTNNKSDLLSAINRSTEVRKKMLNKKNNN
jgi:hypothetical protein